MALWATGFEAGDTAYYRDEVGWQFSFSGTDSEITTDPSLIHTSLDGHGGLQALYVTDTVLAPAHGLGGRWLHFWLGPNINALFRAQFFILDSIQSSVSFDELGNLIIYRGNTTIQAAGTYVQGVPHWIAIEMEALNSGTCNVYVDGVLELSFSGDLTDSNLENWDRIGFTSTNANVSIDDIIVTTVAEGQLGEHFLIPMVPDGNDLINSGAGSTGGAGTFANVDENPPDSSTYNEFTVPGTDRYTTLNLVFTPASIHSVQVINYATRDGTIDQMQSVCATDTSGGGVTEALGQVESTPSGVYAPWISIFNTDPDTAAAWTSAGLDDLRIGVQFS